MLTASDPSPFEPGAQPFKPVSFRGSRSERPESIGRQSWWMNGFRARAAHAPGMTARIYATIFSNVAISAAGAVTFGA